MRHTIILLFLCTLTPLKKIKSQEKEDNLIYFKKCISEQNYNDAAESGMEILLEAKSTITIDEKLRTLHSTLTSLFYTQRLKNAYNFILELETNNKKDTLLSFYINLYKATLLLSQRQSQEAKNIFEKLIQENKTIFLHDSVKAKIYHNLAVISLLEGNSNQELFYRTESFNLEKKLLQSHNNYKNFNLSAATYAGILCNRFKQYGNANEIYKETLQLKFNQQLSPANHTLYKSYLGYLDEVGFQEQFNFYFKKLENYFISQLPNFKTDLTNLYNDASYNALQQGKYTNTILYCQKALQLDDLNTLESKSSDAAQRAAFVYRILDQKKSCLKYSKVAIKNAKLTNNPRLYRYYAFSAQNHAYFEENKLAYTYLDSAKTSYQKFYKDRSIINYSYENRMAWAYIRLKNFEKSLKHFRNIEKLYKNDDGYQYWNNTYDRAFCLNHLGKYTEAESLLKNNYKKLIKAYPHILHTQSVSTLARLFRRINMELSHGLFQQYLADNDQSKLKEAESYLATIDASFDHIQNKLSFDNDRIARGENYNSFVQLATHINIELYNRTQENTYLQKAFEYSQKGKSYALLLGVNDKKWKVTAGVPSKTIKELNFLKDRFDFYQQQYDKTILAKNNDPILTDTLQQSISHYMTKIDSINTYIETKFPLYHQLKSKPQYTNFSNIQNKLGDDQIAFDFFESDDKIFRFTITPENYRCDILSKDSVFSNNLDIVTKEVSTPFIGQRKAHEIKYFSMAAHYLYKHLFNGYEKTQKQNFIIIPHGKLSYVPFEALLTEDVSNLKPNFKKYPWLLKKHTISYAYNMALIPNYNDKTDRFSRVSAYAPTYTGINPSSGVDLTKNYALDTVLLPLNGVIKEIEGIENSFHSEVFEGKSAHKDNFINSMSNNSILHLAMHSLNDEAQPLNSQLVFASKDSTSGSLKAHEIYNHSIESPLVVLSSCSSGSGFRKKGEGLMSLARAFTYAGVKSQIMTLWPVNDASGAKLINLFYKKLKLGQRKDDALNNSKIEYLNSSNAITAHPYYWANYVISGRTNPVKQKMQTSTFIYLFAFNILVVLYFLWRRNRNINH